MIVWGSRGEQIDLGPVEERNCPVCEKRRPFHVFLKYRWFHLYWVFAFITKKEFWLACSICKKGSILTPEQASNYHHELPIPFMRRYGMAVLIALVAISVLIGTLQ